jgi:hypothetical protein
MQPVRGCTAFGNRTDGSVSEPGSTVNDTSPTMAWSILFSARIDPIDRANALFGDPR